MDVTVRLKVRRDFKISEFEFLTPGPLTPRVNTAPYYVTTGHGPDLMGAAKNAVRHMIKYLQRARGMEAQEAYMLCSIAMDLKINEIVDAPNWVVGAYLPTSIFRA